MVRVLQEEDSPVAGRQVFHMLEQNQSPQEVQKQRNRVEHCAGTCNRPGLQLLTRQQQQQHASVAHAAKQSIHAPT
jgi:predicted Zn-ribbon and HTH transcriptional regulator